MSDNVFENLFNIAESVKTIQKEEDKKLEVLEEIFSLSKLEELKNNNLQENEVNLVDSLLSLASSLKDYQPTEKNIQESIVVEQTVPDKTVEDVFGQLTEFLSNTRNELTLKENDLIRNAQSALSNKLVSTHLKPVDHYEIDRNTIIDRITKSANTFKEQITTGDITLENLQKEFNRFKQLTTLQLHSLGGGGSTKINEMDDIDYSTKQNGYALKWNSTSNKYDFGEVAVSFAAVDEDIIPDVNNTRNLGSASKTWSNGYFQNLYVSGSTLEVSNDAVLKGDIQLGLNSGDSTEDTITVNGRFVSNLEPLTNITYDLGSPNRRWRDIYLSGNTIDLAGATISGDGTGQILISASGATLPQGSKVGTQTIAQSDSATGIVTKSVPIYTQNSGLSTPAATFTMSAGGGLGGSVFQAFTKANGTTQGKFELFSF